jgi:uncharacterized protein YdeI (YjbR/CyaY-like superfamily)
MNTPNPKVDFYFNNAKKWQEEIAQLRAITLDYGLTEALKWDQPCYMLGKSNIVLIHDFNEYCALLFFKGALLKRSEWYSDPTNGECACQMCRRHAKFDLPISKKSWR